MRILKIADCRQGVLGRRPALERAYVALNEGELVAKQVVEFPGKDTLGVSRDVVRLVTSQKNPPPLFKQAVSTYERVYPS